MWDQPDPNGSPGFWRLGQSIDEDGFSTEFVYGDANDPTAASELWELSPGGDPNDPSVQPGSVSPFPTTGWGTHYRSYWRHAPFERSGWPMERAFERTEASAAPYTGGIETAVHQWRWRFHWIVPPFGAHVGIDYYRYGALEYLDYGQPPDQTGCTCCVGAFNVSLVHVNNRYPHGWYRMFDDAGQPRIVSRLDENEPPSSYSWGSYTPWNTADSTCLRSCFRWIAPLNYSDSSGECCRYFWNGWTPPTRTGDYSNSNGGSHTAFHRCVDECGGSWPHPPGWWTRFTPGWSNLDIVANENDECGGYSSDSDWN